MTNLTLGIGLQGKPNDYTGLYAKAYAQKAAGDAEQRKADKAALDAAMKDVEIDQERVHPALRDDYRREVARVYDDIQGEFQKDPRGAISQVRRKMIDYQSGLNSYLTSSDALFAIEKLDPSKVNIPDDLVMEFRNAQNFGTAGLMKFYEENRDRLEPFGISFGAPSAEGYAPEIAAMVVPRVDLEKNFQAIGNNLGIDFNQVVQEYQRGNKIWLEFARDNQQVRDAAVSFFSDKINLRNAAIRGIDIFTPQGDLDPSKAATWAANLLKGQVESVTRPSGGGGGGRSQVATEIPEGENLRLEGSGVGNTGSYSVRTEGGITPPKKVIATDVGANSFTIDGRPTEQGFRGRRSITVSSLEVVPVYTGPRIEIRNGDQILDENGNVIQYNDPKGNSFFIEPGMPVPAVWLDTNNPIMRARLGNNVVNRKFMVGIASSPGAGYLEEKTIYVPIDKLVRGNLLSTYSGDAKMKSFLEDISDVPYRRSGGASRPTGGTNRPAQPRSNTPAPPPSGGTPSSGSIPSRPNGVGINNSVGQHFD